MLSDEDEDEEKERTNLVEDDSVLSSKVGGTLRFNEPQRDTSEIETIRTWSKTSQCSSSSTGDMASPKRSSQRVTFEIVSAKTVSQTRKKFVSYTVLIKRVPGLERQPGVLERRYTDFLHLYQSLKKHFPSVLNDFPFPKKALLGNFTAEVITERSVAFQHLLAYIFSISELRQSVEVAEFFYNRELQDAHKMMKVGQFEDASVILENVYFVQEKLLGEDHFSTYYTLCILIACLNAVDNISEAQKYAEIALLYIPKHNKSDLTIPLLVLSIRLWWAVGKDKRDLEKKVQEMKKNGINVEKQPTLLELVLHRECPLVQN